MIHLLDRLPGFISLLSTMPIPASIKPASLQVITSSLFLSGLSFLVTWIIGKPIIRRLRSMGIGKKVRAEEPSAHMIKMGTPTMGGLIVVLGVFIVNAAFNLWGSWSILLPLGVVLSCGILGAVDDLLNLTGGKSTGLTARFKFSWLTLFAIAAALILHYYPYNLHSVYVPFVGKFDIGWWYIPIAVLVIVGTSNAVNLTDGLDTLAPGLLMISFAAYGVIAFLGGWIYITPLCFTTAGALAAFLWYNAHPAQVIMGDTGALSLGALLAVAALMTGQWLLLPLIGIVFVAVAGSVMLQVAYFKLTKGKRLFKMAPLHLHFELLGWSETQIAMRFWVVGVVAALVGIAIAFY